MSSIGTLYAWPHDPRQQKASITAEYCNKHIKVVQDSHFDKSSEFSKTFTKGTKVPAFYDSVQKVNVMESTGIAYHIAKFYDQTNKLLGNTKLEESTIAQWLFYSDTNVWAASFGIATMYYGYNPHDKKKEEELLTKLKSNLVYLDKYLLHNTYLGSENISLADIVMTGSLAWAFAQYLEEKDRREYANVMRWFNTCINQPQFKKYYPEYKLCEKRAAVSKQPPQAPKSEAKDSKKSVKPTAKPAAKIEEAPKKEEKKKHPCEELPPTSMNLDAWKREYSNNDTRPVALKWFWDNFDSQGYSVWHVTYKYNDELTMTFMSSNLVGGFYQRIERARKYAFGTMLVLGENNNNQIEGFFVCRGQEIVPEIVDAADFPSYEFTKINVLDKKWKTKFEDFLAWDGHLDGKKFADGKIFK
eukprot:NODE_217_length_12479_cov_0.651212.p3 type:complete len:415 gc:universal NODE_217_length_12479_cov_0.651212:1402-2646(+)